MTVHAVECCRRLEKSQGFSICLLICFRLGGLRPLPQLDPLRVTSRAAVDRRTLLGAVGGDGGRGAGGALCARPGRSTPIGPNDGMLRLRIGVARKSPPINRWWTTTRPVRVTQGLGRGASSPAISTGIPGCAPAGVRLSSGNAQDLPQGLLSRCTAGPYLLFTPSWAGAICSPLAHRHRSDAGRMGRAVACRPSQSPVSVLFVALSDPEVTLVAFGVRPLPVSYTHL